MRLTNITLLMSVALCGCNTFGNGLFSDQPYLIEPQSSNNMAPLEASYNFKQHYNRQIDLPDVNADVIRSTQLTQNDVNYKNINHYVRAMMQDMVSNLRYVDSTAPVAVASFVFLDEPYDKASLLGNQIAESFIHEIRKFDISVLDYKTMDYIMVTPEGDFAQSRDFEELSNVTQISYIVTGTLVKHQRGYLVNARMISLKSKVVVASAQRLIPESIANALMSSKTIIKKEQVIKQVVSLVQD
jgi:TolB-like protein